MEVNFPPAKIQPLPLRNVNTAPFIAFGAHDVNVVPLNAANPVRLELLIVVKVPPTYSHPLVPTAKARTLLFADPVNVDTCAPDEPSTSASSLCVAPPTVVKSPPSAIWPVGSLASAFTEPLAFG